MLESAILKRVRVSAVFSLALRADIAMYLHVFWFWGLGVSLLWFVFY